MKLGRSLTKRMKFLKNETSISGGVVIYYKMATLLFYIDRDGVVITPFSFANKYGNYQIFFVYAKP